MDERRRYFRIEDTIGVSYEALEDGEALSRQAEIDSGGVGPSNSLHEAERQLQLLIDKLRVQNPELGQAIELLNTKFNLLKNDADPSTRDTKVVRASLSACGVSFRIQEHIKVGAKVYIDMTLLPTDLHVQTVADVVNCREDHQQGNLQGKGEWELSLEFNHLSAELEELMIQHIVKRQGRMLAEERRNNP